MRRFTLTALVVAIAMLGLWLGASASTFAINYINPATVVAGEEALLLLVDGIGFAPGSTVHLSRADVGIDEDLVTIRISDTRLYGAVMPEHIAEVGTAQITVRLDATETDPVTLTIAPLEVTLAPDTQTIPVGSAGSLTVTISEPQAEDRVIELESSNPAVASVPATVSIPALNTWADVVIATGISGGTAVITATLDQERGGGTATAEVIVENPAPTIDSLDPDSAVAGRPDLTLAVNGSNFVGSSTVEWNGLALATTFVDGTQLTAVVPAALLAEPGPATVTVANPEPGGGLSNGVQFIITAPTIILTPDPLDMLINSTATMDVTINAAQAEDRVVTLESLDPAIASVPASVTILAGNTTAGFSVNSSASTGSTTVTAWLPAALGGNSATATVNVVNPEPTISSLDPSSAVAGSPALTLTVNGSGYVANSSVQWDGSPLATTFGNSGQLTAAVPAALLATPGSATITVVNPEPGGGVSDGVLFTITAPTITLAPDPLTMVANSTETLTVTISAIQAANRVVTLVSQTPAIASVPASVTILAGNTSASFIVTSGTSTGSTIVTATLPAGLGGNSTTAVVNVVSSNPTIDSLDPATAVAGRPDLALTVNGSGFIVNSTVEWDDAALATTFVSSSQLTAVVPAALLAEPGSATVTVINPAPGGPSNGVTFTITAPTITLTPDPLAMVVNSTAMMDVTINAVQAEDRLVTLESLDPAVASVPASVTIQAGNTAAGFTVTSGASTGSTTITAMLPAALGGNSATATVIVNNPLPAITSLVPDSAIAGDAGFTLAVYGSNFVSGSMVRWNGADRPTTFVSSTELAADIAASDVAEAGTATVQVFNPAPGGGLSNALTFTINNPVPAITAIVPDSATAGDMGFTLTVNGSNFVASSVVRWNGVDRPTTFVSSTQLTASISAADIEAGGTANVTVFNPAPGGGTSNAVSFTIYNPVPELSSISPTSAVAGRPDLTLTVSGSSFVANSMVQWNGLSLDTTFVSSSEVTAIVPAANLNSPGAATITVFNSSPGGGTSNGANFTITALGVTLAADPTDMLVNSSTTMTVTIDQAQAADRVLDLQVEDASLLAAPATVTILGGSLWASFGISSGSLAGSTVVTATLPVDQGGQSASATVNITEEAISGLSASNSSPTTLGQVTYFVATISAGSNVSYEWDLGDGAAGSGPLANHVYSAAGVYTAVVTATNNLNSLTATTTVTITNLAPIADAGPDQIRGLNELVILDGSGSTDPDGHLPLSYGWEQTGGPTVTLDDPSSVQPTFTTPATPAILTFSLVVTDSYGLASEPDQVTINVPEQPAISAGLSVYPPVAHVGEMITYTLTVTNNGNVVLQNLTSTTTVPGGFSLPASLDPGATVSQQYTYVVQQADLPGPLTNLVTVTATTPLNEPVGVSVVAEVVIPQYVVFMPLLLNQYTSTEAPDLIVEALTVAGDGVTIVIANIGNQAVTTPFWVDVYFDPDPPPTAANQIWEMLSSEGLVWGIDSSALPLLPGATMTLVLGDAYFMPENSNFSGTIPAGTAVYAQVDSAHNNQVHGAVLELHEMMDAPYNNVYGPVTASGTFNLTGQIPPGTALPPARDAALPQRPLVDKE